MNYDLGIMKRLKIFFCAVCAICGSFSCSDMLETDSERQLFNPEINQKTDSIFYALGILQGVQQMTDQYFFVGEMRGDLVKLTEYTDNNLRQLANFSATKVNKYDSAYVYYRVINNCNYYIAHCNTNLRTGADFVMMREFVAIKALRAWTYMQLARVYGTVPFYTEPLTEISQIDDEQFERLDMAGIVARLAPDLEQYSGGQYATPPTYGDVKPHDISVSFGKLFVPVDLVLGDMYLETEDYVKAASHYITYLTKVTTVNNTALRQSFMMSMGNFDLLPSDFTSSWPGTNSGVRGTWYNEAVMTTNDAITYVPFAPNRLQGATTGIPYAFGYNYYSTTENYMDEIQVLPSDSYLALSRAQDYYYFSSLSTTTDYKVNSAKLGDTRYDAFTRKDESDTAKVWIQKPMLARVNLYRGTTVMLRLAEAFNRMGMPDAAFAILKDGICSSLVGGKDGDKAPAAYLSSETMAYLKSTILSQENIDKFSREINHFGVHMHGAGLVRDYNGSTYQPGFTTYQPDTIIGLKLAEIAKDFGVTGTTKQDSINAMEDILCDEYALEFSFEGTRFYDLCRLARHKNKAGLYGGNFGGRWLAKKLEYKQPLVDLTDEKNWYLPFN